jgi:hypothetical protein
LKQWIFEKITKKKFHGLGKEDQIFFSSLLPFDEKTARPKNKLNKKVEKT